MCLLSSEGLSKALLQTPQGRSVLSLGLALGVGTVASGKSPCELAAELSPETDFLSSSADGGDPLKALESRDMDKSSGESEIFSSDLMTMMLQIHEGIINRMLAMKQ